jgi:putative nucleotidyltransferase with HDIG domain
MIEAEAAGIEPPDSDGGSMLERELLKRLSTGRAGLPVLPQVAGMALRLANDRNANLAELARLVETDPPIAARFLSVANSALYFRGFVIGSTQAAIVRLGLARTRDLLFQVVYANTTVGLKRFQGEVRASFDRSVRCAIAARVASQVLGAPLELAYMCGLLHDIGEARIYRVFEGMPAVAPGSAEVERLVRKHHNRAGAEIAMAWHLPSEIVDACAAHHDVGATESNAVRLVMLSDLITAEVEPELEDIEALGVNDAQWRRLKETFERESGVGRQRLNLTTAI